MSTGKPIANEKRKFTKIHLPEWAKGTKSECISEWRTARKLKTT